jgi:very-short-patch-repair endonuclease
MPGNARNLRRNQTEAERLLWSRLRNRRLAGYKFRRQHPVAGFVADFACPDAGLVVEVDGGQHLTEAEADAARSQSLAEAGFRVIRFWNNQVLTETEAVLAEILRALQEGK